MQLINSLSKTLFAASLSVAFVATTHASETIENPSILADFGPGTIVEATVRSDDGDRDNVYILADNQGQPLYWYAHDLGEGQSVCVADGGCLGRWPIFAATGPDQYDQFEILDREDGAGEQWMFVWSEDDTEGMEEVYPLYYWVADVAPTDPNAPIVANGEVGFTNWHVIEFELDDSGENFVLVTDPDDFPPQE